MKVFKSIVHTKGALDIATEYGWLPRARFTNLRDIKACDFKSRDFLILIGKIMIFHDTMGVRHKKAKNNNCFECGVWRWAHSQLSPTNIVQSWSFILGK